MKRHQPRICIIGLDGATYHLIGPWTKQGLLPTFARLMKEGVWGEMESTVPPLTPPAWTTFMTGVNPGKHGLFDFIEPEPNAYTMRYNNGASRQSETIWQVLNRRNYSVGIFNVPMTYPPEPLTAYQIAGLDTPDADSAFVHPPALKTELTRVFGPFELDVRFLGYMYTDERRDEVLAALKRIDRNRTEMALYLMEHYPTDLIMVNFMSADTVQHYFWHQMDPNHPAHLPLANPKYRDAILKVYQHLDDCLSALLQRLPEEAAVLVVSDHGAGPSPKRILYLNRFLHQIGLLQFKPEIHQRLKPGTLLYKGIKKCDDFLRKQLSSRQKAFLAHRFPKLQKQWESTLNLYQSIDWTATSVYSYDVLAFPPTLWVNLHGRQPMGTVSPGRDYEKVVQKTVDQLLGLKDPVTGHPIIPRVFRKEEIYHGPYLNRAPDLTLDWWSGDGFLVKPTTPEQLNEIPLGSHQIGQGQKSEWSGTHRLHGILLLHGPKFKSGHHVSGASLADIAPTLLYWLGESIPAYFDGRVLDEVFDGVHFKSHPVIFCTGEGEGGGQGDRPYREEEAAKVEERLRSLGYLE